MRITIDIDVKEVEKDFGGGEDCGKYFIKVNTHDMIDYYVLYTDRDNGSGDLHNLKREPENFNELPSIELKDVYCYGQNAIYREVGKDLDSLTQY